MELEEAIFQIIACAGNARSDAFEALAFARNGNIEEAKRLISRAGEELHKAHEVQNSLIFGEAQGQELPVKLIMVHAEDHLMCAILARDLIKEMIYLYEKLDEKSKKEGSDHETRT